MNEPNDLVCFSHLRWNFVFQRPNHLMERCSRERRVFFVEEPVFDAEQLGISVDHIEDLFVVVPRLPRDTAAKDVPSLLAECYAQLFRQFEIKDPIAWYYTPMSLLATRDFQFSMVVYDCMDQLSAFYGAPPELVSLERELLSIARLVFTGGQSLYEEKRYQHPNVHAFPSSVDAAHFGRARKALPEPADQGHIPHPRLGFYGVIDERMDLDLLAYVARERPSWQVVLLGPVVKIDPGVLPRAPNLHYLGMKEYRELPDYLSGWDVAIMPFAENEATRFISPTKTLEYLAGGRPVVSTPIRDVVHPYADEGLVRCARREGFVEAVEVALAEGFAPIQARVDELLARTSWDRTWSDMSQLLSQYLPARSEPVKAAG
ncbi:MAG: glycosyltransferase [Myxococcota bacterium]|nr:glycosyltransferase [Myxococcota bacterium]